jgi:hypothetical protein
MRAKTIITTCLALAWLAVQSAMVLAHYAPVADNGPACAHDTAAKPHSTAAETDHHGHGGHAKCDHGAAGGVSSPGCCSVACVAFIVVASVLAVPVASTYAFSERIAEQPRAIISLLGTPPPNAHLWIGSSEVCRPYLTQISVSSNRVSEGGNAMQPFVSLALSGLILVASSASPFAAERADATDPAAPVPPLIYHPVMSGYEETVSTTRPADWRELNDRMERIGGPGGQLRDPDEPIRERW